MCGIFGFSGEREEIPELVLTGLKDLEYRGYDSWGVVVRTDEGELAVEKEVGKIGTHVLSLTTKTHVVIGHTRWATHGGVTRANAHPHVSPNGKIALIHNGIVENYEEIKSQLKRRDNFASETDSEVVVHLIEELLVDHPFVEAVSEAFNRLEGMNAIVVLEGDSGIIVAAKKGSPLVLGVAMDGVFLASDASAILPFTKEIVFIEDGQMVQIEGQAWAISRVKDGVQLDVQPQTLHWKVEQSTLGRFEHFMLKEIFEQPRILRHLAEHGAEKVEDLALLVQAAYGTFLIGCGTASYAALSGTYLLSRVTSKHVNFVVGSEFFYQEQYLTPESLILAISQSGETMDIVESVHLAQKHGAKIAAMTNTLGSTLYREADAKVLLDAGVEKAVCATKSFTAMVSLLLLLAYRLAGRVEIAQQLLLQTADDIEQMLQPDNLQRLKEVAEYLKEYRDVFIIGRGLSYAASLEAALKIKEVSYIHAEGFAGGELKHGVIALIESGTPCIVFAPEDETTASIVSNAMELKARGAYIIGVGPREHSVYDVWLPTANVGDASIISQVVPAQLLGYYLALAKGLDPDKPRNLAKSVTVR